MPAKGVEWLNNPIFNKGTAFTAAERDALGLRGLLPPHVNTMEQQVMRVMSNGMVGSLPRPGRRVRIRGVQTPG